MAATNAAALGVLSNTGMIAGKDLQNRDLQNSR